MSDRSFFPRLSPDQLKQVASQWAPKIILLSVLIIVVSTLYPFKFTVTEATLQRALNLEFRSWTNRLDILANIVLFLPLGFGLASALVKRPFAPLTKLLAILLMSGAMSFAIEMGQLFLPGRNATTFDVLFNTVGGGVGYVLFLIGGTFCYRFTTLITGAIQRLLAKFSLKQLVLGLVGYVTVVALLVIFWQGHSLRTWTPNLPLVLGDNTPTEEYGLNSMNVSAWDGTISDLVISDRALVKTEVERFFADPIAFSEGNPSVLAIYPLKGKQGHQDLTQQAPSLVWQGSSPEVPSQVGISQTGTRLSARHWLRTSDPVTSINQRIQKSSQFTLSARITPATTTGEVFNFRRILSIDRSDATGNLVLAQTQSELLILLKSSSAKFMHWQLLPNAFTDNKPHQFLLTYSAFILRVYIDGAERSFIVDMTPSRYQTILYVAILVPLALLIGLIASRLRRVVPIYLFLIGGGTFLPAIVLESYLASGGDRSIRIANLLLSVLIMGGTILVCKGSFSDKSNSDHLANSY
jgi:glycopeptide antibiotics resistance protein